MSAGHDILTFLKTAGSATTRAVADRLAVSRQAAKVHLDKLADEGLIFAGKAQVGVGRPKKLWSLTEKANARFPDSHAEMTVELIAAVKAEFGEAGLDRLIGRRERAVEKAYREFLSGVSGLEARLERLKNIRAAEGYMPEWTRDDDGYLFVENHCPICAAAAACQGFCRSELTIFRALLAPAQVERTDHILAGQRRCAYRVTPQAV